MNQRNEMMKPTLVKTIPGGLNDYNHGACEWSVSGLLAFGCQNVVVVVHPASIQVVQTFDGHKSSVTKVRWAHEELCEEQHGLLLSSGDVYGCIIVWAVRSAVQKCVLTDRGKSVVDMHWLWHQGEQRDYLLSLHAPAVINLWCMRSSSRLWTKSYATPLLMFTLDPYDAARAAFLTSVGTVMLVDDLSVKHPPSAPNGRQHFRMSNLIGAAGQSALVTTTTSPSSSSGTTPSTPHAPPSGPGLGLVTSPSSEGIRMPAMAEKLRKPLLQVYAAATGSTTDVSKIDDSSLKSPSSDSTCISAQFHPTVRNLLLLAYRREMLALDLDSLQTAAHIVLDRSYSNLVTVLPTAQLEAYYFVQENGCITVRTRRRESNSIQDAENLQKHDVKIDPYCPTERFFDPVCNSESLRVTKNYRVAGACLDNVTGLNVCLLMTNGRLIVYRLDEAECSIEESVAQCLPRTINTMLQPYFRHCTTAPNRLKSKDSAESVESDDPDSEKKETDDAAEKPKIFIPKPVLAMTGMLSSVGPLPTVIRTRRTTGEIRVAVGTQEGFVQLIDLLTSEIVKDISVHSTGVKCLEWAEDNVIISCACVPTLSAANVVRNELFATDLRVGVAKRIRNETEESAIDLLRVSHYSRFLAIAFAGQPLEIWDLSSMRMLKKMGRNCPVVVDIAWSTKHHQATKMGRRGSEASQTSQNSQDAAPVIGPSGDHEKVARQGSSGSEEMIYRENLVLLDNDNNLYHIIVKGMHVRDGKEVTTQWQSNSSATCMVWKDDYLAFGDTDGRIQLWDISGKEARVATTQLGAVKRIRFSPGQGQTSLFALHSGGLSVWDPAKLECLNQLAINRDFPHGVVAYEFDLVGRDGSMLLLTDDGCIRLYTAYRHIAEIFVNNANIDLFCPPLLNSRQAKRLSVILSDENVIREHSLTKEFMLAKYDTPIGGLSERECIELLNHIKSLDREDVDLIADLNTPLTARLMRCAQLFGSSWEFEFAHLLDYFYPVQSQPPPNSLIDLDTNASSDQKADSSTPVPDLMQNGLSNGSNQATSTLSDPIVCSEGELDDLASRYLPCDDLLLSPKSFRRRALDRCATFDVRRASPEQISSQVDRLIMLGQRERATELLLESDPAKPGYFTDCLRACFIAAVEDSKNCQSTVKLVSTNLIATGKVTEGVLLLCLIGRSLDACRYLQSHGDWRRSVSLAKASLPQDTAVEVIRKYAEHLCTAGDNPNSHLSVLLLLSLKQISRVLELLIIMRYVRWR